MDLRDIFHDWCKKIVQKLNHVIQALQKNCVYEIHIQLVISGVMKFIWGF